MILRLLVLAILCIAQSLQGQVRQPLVEMPFYRQNEVVSFFSGRFNDDILYLPVEVKVSYANGEYHNMYYQYNEEGGLQRFWDGKGSEFIYNGAYAVGQKDFPDTIIYYKVDEAGRTVPQKQIVYDCRGASLYHGEAIRIWENNNWHETHRKESFLTDTLMLAGFDYQALVYEEGTPKEGYLRIMEFDEDCNVKSIITKEYKPETDSYSDYSMTEYLYDTNNVCFEALVYFNIDNVWTLKGKQVLHWKEYYGFLDGDLLYYNLAEPLSPQKENKIQSRTSLSYVEDDEDGTLGWDFDFMEETWWNIDGRNSMEQYAYKYSLNTNALYTQLFKFLYYDAYGNRVKEGFVYYTAPDSMKQQGIRMYTLDSLVNYYDENGRFYKFEQYQIFFNGTSEYDNFTPRYICTAEVDSFAGFANTHYTVSPEIVISRKKDKVAIQSNEAMAAISIYDSHNKRTYHHSFIKGKKHTIEAGILSKGIYIVEVCSKTGNTSRKRVRI